MTAKDLPFLKTRGTDIVNEAGERVVLRGVSLGGWLMMEGYMLCGRNIPERAFKEGFLKTLGKEALDDFERCYRDTFITEEDIVLIKSWGANCIRIPFNYRVIEFEDRPFSLNESGFAYLDRAVEWCEKHGIYCILDMHSAPGCQNPGWHSDSYGEVELFSKEENKNRYYRLWHFLAEHFKDSSAVAGYDVLNEPVLPVTDEKPLKDLYDRVIGEIRSVDTRHVIFLEGNMWSQRLRCIGRPKDDNVAYSVHAYPPLNFTHNFDIGLEYPGRAYGINWNKQKFNIMAEPYRRLAMKNRMPIYIGEFGVNARDGYYGENKWVSDFLDIFEKNGFSWTYWTYKTVANYAYPDGILRYLKDPAWVHREGPVYGWETFASLWPKEKGSMIFSWRTENFTRNEKLFAVLKRFFE